MSRYLCYKCGNEKDTENTVAYCAPCASLNSMRQDARIAQLESRIAAADRLYKDMCKISRLTAPITAQTDRDAPRVNREIESIACEAIGFYEAASRQEGEVNE